jgi:hypothetical protein
MDAFRVQLAGWLPHPRVFTKDRFQSANQSSQPVMIWALRGCQQFSTQHFPVIAVIRKARVSQIYQPQRRLMWTRCINDGGTRLIEIGYRRRRTNSLWVHHPPDLVLHEALSCFPHAFIRFPTAIRSTNGRKHLCIRSLVLPCKHLLILSVYVIRLFLSHF